VAIKTPLRPVARRIAQAVRSFATSQGLVDGDYALAGSWDEKTGRISLVFGADRPIDEKLWYAGILESLRKTFADHPSVVMHIGLVVENVRSLDDVYLRFPSDEDEDDLTDLLERS
jgi:hypothetical protein